MFIEKKERFHPSFGFMFLCFMFIFFIISLFMSLEVHAQENTEQETETDLDQNERLNNLEIRLAEYGYTIKNIEEVTASLQEADMLLDEQLNNISMQLEIIIPVLFDLFYLEDSHLQLYSNEIVNNECFRNDVSSALADQCVILDDINKNTVSGNTIVSNFNDSFEENLQVTSESTIKEFTETLLTTNTLLSYVFVLLLFVLVMFLVYGLGALIHNMLNKHVH